MLQISLVRDSMLETEMKVKTPDLTAPARRKDDREVTSGYYTACLSKLQKAGEGPWKFHEEPGCAWVKRRWSAYASGVDRHMECECQLHSSWS